MRLRLLLCAVLILAMAGTEAEEPRRTFGVLNQRSATLTAKYWNPILAYVSNHSGVMLELDMGKTAPQTTARTARGEFDFVYSNHIFMPSVAKQGYSVIARPLDKSIRGQIVVLSSSPIRKLNELNGRVVGFPSATAFVGYAVAMDALLQQGMHVSPVFAGNQEGIMGQLKAGRVSAAAVNSRIMRDYALREHLAYRVLWSSDSYLNLPVAAHPRVSHAESKAVTAAFVAMSSDPVGKRILESSAAIIGQGPPYGFVHADDHDYRNYRQYYRTTLLKEFR